MPRTARLVVPGWPHHVMQRGHNKERCFLETRDYELYLGLLEEFAPVHGCAVHAYVLMTNHIHLLLTPATVNSIAQFTRAVNQRFVQWVNRTYHRCGSSWQGRSRSSVVDSDGYFLTCQRYIELNPVRAGMVGHPADYRWSSYRSNAIGVPSSLLRPHDVYLGLATSNEKRQTAYRELFADEIDAGWLEQVRVALMGNRPLGSEAFIAAMQPRLEGRAVRRRRGRQPVEEASSPDLFR